MYRWINRGVLMSCHRNSRGFFVLEATVPTVCLSIFYVNEVDPHNQQRKSRANSICRKSRSDPNSLYGKFNTKSTFNIVLNQLSGQRLAPTLVQRFDQPDAAAKSKCSKPDCEEKVVVELSWAMLITKWFWSAEQTSPACVRRNQWIDFLFKLDEVYSGFFLFRRKSSDSWSRHNRRQIEEIWPYLGGG